MNYYIDTCIWLNLFKKESSLMNGMTHWQIAKNFVECVEKNNDTIIVSTIVLKEIYFQIEEKFMDIKKYFKEQAFIQIIKTTNEDYSLAREFEQKHNILSFYDYLHTAIAKRLQTTLVTRDKELIDFASNHIDVFKPEELIS